MRHSKGPGFAGAFFVVICFPDDTAADKPNRVLPSVTPTDAVIEAWSALSRDEQVRRYQEMFQHPDCNNFTTDTSDEILAAARQRVACRLTAEEDADLAEDEDEIARGDLASEDEVNAMWKKHGR
jgi:hypothetical protein